MSDLPDRSRSVVPSQTFHLSPSFGQPWFANGSGSVNSGATATYDIAFNDDSFVYYVDEIVIYGPNAKQFQTEFDFNAAPIVICTGDSNFTYPMRGNPSIFWITGDHLYIKIKNMEASAYAYGYTLSGTKIPRPPTWGHPPLAVTAVDHNPIAHGALATFSSTSAYSPTTFDWDFDDGSAHATTQNCTHTFAVAGTYHVKFTCWNQYGYDTIIITEVVT